jgi:diguanylate cyclase (GGDEF)-like protein
VTVEEKLGENQYRRVFRVSRHGETYALKIASEHNSPEVHDLFRREAAALARVQHPLLPTAWTVGDVDDWPYIVTDLIPGRALAEWLDSGSLTPERSVRVTLDLLRGLGALHAHGYLHGDLTPDSIIWDQREARIADFGRTTQRRHQTINRTGGATYMAPEQTSMLNRLVDERSDLFTVGAILFECLTGRPAHPAEDTEDLTDRLTGAPPTLPDELRASISEALRDFLFRLVRTEPNERPSGAQAAIEQLADTPEARQTNGEQALDETVVPEFTMPSGSERLAQARRLERGWQTVHRSGRGLLSVIEGEQGIGKSNLIDTLTHNVTPAPSKIARVTCSVTASSPLEAIYALVSSISGQSRASRPQTAWPDDLDPVDPSSDGLGDISSNDFTLAAESSTADTNPAALADELTEAAAAASGIMVIVEQIERADPQTLGVLQRIAMALHKAPIHLIVTSTLDEDDSTAARRIWEAAAPSAQSTVPEESTRQHTRLATLDRSGTAEYLEAYLGRTIADEAIVDAVYRTTTGNPLLTSEYANILLSSSSIRPDWDGWVTDSGSLEEVEFDADASSLLKRRLRELDEPVLDILELAAFWGDSMPVALAARAVQASASDARTRLDAAATHGILIRESSTSGEATDDSSYRFRSRAYQRILKHELGDQQRRQLHQQLGEAGAAVGESPFAVAIHLARGTDDSPRQTFRYCLRAGWEAHQSHAYETAVTLLTAAQSACEQLPQPVPPDLLYLLGHAQIECEQLQCGRAHIEQAIERTNDDLARARYQAALNESLVTGFQLEKLERGVRKGLRWAGSPLPTNSMLLLGALLVRMATYAVWRVVGAPEVTDRHERRRLQLLTRTYHHLSLAATGMGSNMLTLFSQFARLITAMPLGPSFELVVAESSFGYVLGITGRKDLGRRMLDRAEETADRADTKRARVRLEAIEGLFATATGEPLASQRRLERLLRDKGDHLQFSDRILVLQDLLWNLAARGHSREVVHWYHWWKDRVELEAISGESPRASMVFSLTMWHARLLGRDDLADTLREKSARVAAPSEWMAAELADQTGIVRDDLVQGDLEAAREHVEDIHAVPADGIVWTRSAEMTTAIARMYLFEETHSESDLVAYRQAVDELREVNDGHPIVQCHAEFHTARLALARQAPADQIGRHLEAAERVARDIEDRWIRVEVARTRAMWLDEGQAPSEHRDFARQAVSRANRAGWRRTADRLSAEFDLQDSANSSPSETTDPSHPGESGISHADTRRQLDAVIRASLATYDPSESDLRTSILEASILALGATRGAVIEYDNRADQRETGELSVTRTSASPSSDGDQDIEEASLDWETIQEVTRSGESKLVTRDAQDDDGHASILVVPLEADTHVRGALYLDNRQARGVFSDSDIDVAQTIAHQLTAALAKQHSTRLEVEVESEREQREYAERLQAFFRDVSTSLDLFDISERLVRELIEFLGGDAGYVVSLLRDPPVTAATGNLEGTRSGPFDADADVYGEVETWRRLEAYLDQQGPTWIESVSDDDNLRPFTATTEDPPVGSWLAVPMRADDAMIGYVVVGHADTHAFSTTEVQQVQTFVAQAAIAIDRVQLATFDDLTGLHNRRKFFEYAHEHWRVSQNAPRPLSILLLDIDDFKVINDSHGHATGDRVLETVAEACRDSLRESDIIGRYGGEEFAILLPGTALGAAANTVAERIRRRVHELVFETDDAETFTVSVSVGAAEKRECDSSVDDLLDRADSALYAAKSAGKNQVQTEPDTD